MRIKIITYGCAYNKSDSAIIKKLLEKKGHKIVKNKAELIIVNTCTVKKPTENKIIKKLEELKEKKVLVTGCLVEVKKKNLKKRFPQHLFAELDELESIPDIINNEPSQKKKSNRARLEQEENEIIKIIPIADGCLGNCAYCITKKARGHLHSFPIEDIVKQVSSKEVWLTAQDMSTYGLDIGTNLAKLLKKIKGNSKIRVGMMNSKHVLKILPELIDAYKSNSIFKFLHLPVQSGSDKVLKEMNRGYTTKSFEKIIMEFRKTFPKITIATDIITGFPTETENDFKKTIELVQKIRPDVINISMYCAMEGTQASELKQLPNIIRKERSRKITKLFQQISLENNKKWVGWKGEILIDEKNKNGMIGRNYAYKQVIINNGTIGETVMVKIVEAKTHCLIGEIINE
ncbi:MAG: tRNA (N(6)-L-threonylcarbamoyladenosine(37)-C(2))-methylthiotransferase [Nanoarchaeota archaeon]|nr:tRNA (N(6)-L-threonylcarbamoyladenosine(37)-C(2))-methylthiotransferase [Nanoarchaeota archaeon]